MKKKPITKFEVEKLAAKQFLYKDLPEEWPSMSQEESLGFIADALWYPLEDMEPEAVMDLIYSCVDDVEALLKTHGIEVLE